MASVHTRCGENAYDNQVHPCIRFDSNFCNRFQAKKKPFIPSKVEVNGNADDIAKLGIKTYVANCAMCHGKDGKKMYRDATDLSTSGIDQASAELIVKEGSSGTLKHGQVKMPAFAATLSDEEIIAVSAYVQTLRR